MTRVRDIRLILLVVFGLLTCAPGASGDETAVCRKHPPPGLVRLKEIMAHGRFVSYQPTSLQIIDGRATHADEASIADDLTVLRTRFDGLVTYGALNGAERIPDVAATMGFRAVIIGVWDITNKEEITNAIAAWRRHPDLVVGISIGNEIVFGKRGTFESIDRALEAVRINAPGVLLTTSEPFHLFYERDAAATLATIDFMLVNVHPVFQPWFPQAPDENAAQFVVNVVDRLAQIYCGPVLVKETGEPTAPAAAGYSASRQADFYRLLRDAFASTPMRAFAYFAAFDAPWRVDDSHPVPGYHPEEAYWGLYDERRKPKAVVATIPEL
jgi:exo-beta-1,3-glucanase (GH17 family)